MNMKPIFTSVKARSGVAGGPKGRLNAVIEIEGYSHTVEEARQLVEASPALLEALQDALGWLACSDVAYLIGVKKGESAHYNKTINAVRAAIAAAVK